MVDKVKKIGNYKVKFKTFFDSSKSDLINLNIEISQDLRKLIKSVCLDTITQGNLSGVNTQQVFRRYKVKGWLYSSLNYYKDVLFHEDLVNNKECVISFVSVTELNNFLSEIKYTLRSLIECINKSKIDLTLKINVEVER